MNRLQRSNNMLTSKGKSRTIDTFSIMTKVFERRSTSQNRTACSNVTNTFVAKNTMNISQDYSQGVDFSKTTKARPGTTSYLLSKSMRREKHQTFLNQKIKDGLFKHFDTCPAALEVNLFFNKSLIVLMFKQ